jgi:hypothetical protein
LSRGEKRISSKEKQIRARRRIFHALPCPIFFVDQAFFTLGIKI